MIMMAGVGDSHAWDPLPAGEGEGEDEGGKREREGADTGRAVQTCFRYSKIRSVSRPVSF